MHNPKLVHVLRRVAKACFLALLLAVPLASAVMYVAWQHNPQGEFHGDDGVHWSAWLSVGWPIVLLIVVPAALVTLLVAILDSGDGRRGDPPARS